MIYPYTNDGRVKKLEKKKKRMSGIFSHMSCQMLSDYQPPLVLSQSTFLHHQHIYTLGGSSQDMEYKNGL